MNSPPTTTDVSMEERLREHGAKLLQDGIGEVSVMARISVMKELMSDPQLGEIHAREGKKFGAMAQKIAPPALVADYFRHIGEEYPPIIALPPDDLQQTFLKFVVMTEPRQEHLTDDARGKGGDFRYKPSETDGYIERCQRDPTLQLALIYTSASLQYFVVDVLKKMKRTDMDEDIIAFGTQFNATNLVTTLPLALHICLERRHGKDAPSAMIDLPTVEDAMKFLHTTEQFSIRGRNRQTGEQIALRCPMEGYVNELFVKHDGLLPMIAATQRLQDACRGQTIDGLLAQADQRPFIHLQNANLVGMTARTLSSS